AGALHLVGREDPSGVADPVAVDHRQVLTLVTGNRAGARGEGLDAATGDAGAPAPGSGQPAGDRLCGPCPYGHWKGPVRASVRSKPNAMLKHSTPCPEAPFTRLSIAAVTMALSPWAATFTRQRFEWLVSLVAGESGATLGNGWPW